MAENVDQMEKVNACFENATLVRITDADIIDMERDMTKCMSYKACKKSTSVENWPTDSPITTTTTTSTSTLTTTTTTEPDTIAPELIPDPNLPDFNDLNYDFNWAKKPMNHCRRIIVY